MQNTATLDFNRYWNDVMKGFTFSFGGEFRYENYQIFAGEEKSWQTYPLIWSIDTTYDSIGNIISVDTTNRPGGSQGFPGFRPSNVVNESRTNVGAYADVALNVTDQFIFDVAVRGENYSDFGGTFNGRLALRFAPIEKFALRGSVSTTTFGLDFVLNYDLNLSSSDRLSFSLLGNVNKMKVDKVTTNDLLAGKEDSYFGPRDSAFLVNSAPPYKINFGITYTHNKFTAVLHTNFWSGLKFYDYDPKPYKYKGAVTFDVSLGYNITKNISLFIGALNLTNQYPKWDYNPAYGAGSDATGYDPYETESDGAWDAVQMGFDGTFLFAKLGLNF